MTTVSVFGGTGFLGRRLVRRLATEGATVRVAVRHPERARGLGAAGLDRVTVLCADVRDQASVAAAVAGADAVVNAVSAYLEKGEVTFESVHERGARTVAREAAAAGVARLVLVSGIGADPESASPYIRARVDSLLSASVGWRQEVAQHGRVGVAKSSAGRLRAEHTHVERQPFGHPFALVDLESLGRWQALNSAPQ